jgi:hypothetical protein
MTYRWDNFVSRQYAMDVGVGQGLALSPVFSALYLAPIIKLFTASIPQEVANIISYMDDDTIIVQSEKVPQSLPKLKTVYAEVYHLFTALGLVLEHDKSEVFHFTHAQGVANNPPIDIGLAPFTGDSLLSLCPKPIWWYLGFYFDWVLSFKEHVQFYSTKALITVKALGMLGNSS